MTPLQESTIAAAQAAELAASAVRQACTSAEAAPGPDDAAALLLREALTDAVKLMRRLQAIHACTLLPNYGERAP